MQKYQLVLTWQAMSSNILSLSRKILLSHHFKGGPSKHHTHIENCETVVSHSSFTSNPHLGTHKHKRPNDCPSKLISTCIVAFTQKSKTKKSYSISTCIVRSRRISIIESQETLLSKRKRKLTQKKEKRKRKDFSKNKKEKKKKKKEKKRNHTVLVTNTTSLHIHFSSHIAANSVPDLLKGYF